MNNIENKVITFVTKEISAGKNEVKLNKRLLEDLGVDGDDAFDLIKKYAKEFNVNISDFKFEEYFGPEVSYIFRLLYPFKQKELKTLTVLDLINGVKKGKLG